jgi:DNA-binding PadR family transcriptional regulator
MIATLDAPRTLLRPRPAPPDGGTGRATASDLLRLMALREIEDAGPRTGAEVFEALAGLVCSFGLDSPGYAVLHDLQDAGFLAAKEERPPRYAVTAAGRREAERLSVRCWPGIRAGLIALNVCLGCLAPRQSVETI